MSKKINDTPDAWVRLSDVLRECKNIWPWASPAVIREAVLKGKIASYRSSKKKRSWQYVQWAAVATYLDTLKH
jgi:hypothetical protein